MRFKPIGFRYYQVDTEECYEYTLGISFVISYDRKSIGIKIGRVLYCFDFWWKQKRF